MIENLQFRMIDISSSRNIFVGFKSLKLCSHLKIKNLKFSRIEIISVKSASLHKMHFSNYFQLYQFVVDSFTGKRISGINYIEIKIERRKAINQTAFWTSDFRLLVAANFFFFYFARMKSRDFNLLSHFAYGPAKESGQVALLASTCMIKGNFETWVGAQMDEIAINNHRAFNRVCLLSCLRANNLIAFSLIFLKSIIGLIWSQGVHQNKTCTTFP